MYATQNGILVYFTNDLSSSSFVKHGRGLLIVRYQHFPDLPLLTFFTSDADGKNKNLFTLDGLENQLIFSKKIFNDV